MAWYYAHILAIICLAMAVLGCPENCKCTNANTHVNCEHLNLQEVPEDIPLTTVELYLGFNLLTRIRENVFKKLANLVTLSLKNNNIVTLEAGGFNGIPKLTVLYLTGNGIVDIPAEVFKGLPALQNLYLTQNHIQVIPDLRYTVGLKRLNLDNNNLQNCTFPPSYSNLKNLTQVVLANNYGIEHIRSGDFVSLANAQVTKLTLTRCGLLEIDNGSFTPLTKLVSLSLSFNPNLDPAHLRAVFDGLGGSTVTSLDIKNLIMDHDLPADTFVALQDVPLLSLFMSNSQVDVVRDHTFDYFPKLTLLDFSHSGIQDSENNAFSGLTKVKTLKLYLNNLIRIPNNLPENLESLDLSFNPHLGLIPGKIFIQIRTLKELRIHHCGIGQVSSDAFRGVELMEVLDLSNNNIAGNTIGVSVLKDMDKLKYLFLNKNNIQSIDNEVNLFQGLVSLYYLDLRSNGMKSMPRGIFTPLGQLELLHLQSNLLGDYLRADVNGETFAGLSSLRELHLDDNAITALPGSLFKDLGALERLVLRNNYLSQWGGDLLQQLSHLQIADMSTNKLAILSEQTMKTLPYHLKVNLTDNPFNCWCDMMWFRDWLNNPTNNVTLLNTSLYVCASPQSMQGKDLLDFQPADIKNNCNWQYVLYGTVGGLAGLVLISLFVVYRYRWRIRFCMYRMKRRVVRVPRDGYEPIAGGGDYEYDAYIVVSEDVEADERWVEDDLLPEMHNGDDFGGQMGEFQGRHRFFYPRRSHAQGRSNAEQLEVFHDSNKIVVVLSEPSLRRNTSKFVQFELAMVLEMVKDRGWEAVILVLKDDEVVARVHPTYRQRIEAGHALRWTVNPDGMAQFWEEMRTAMAGVPPREPHVEDV